MTPISWFTESSFNCRLKAFSVSCILRSILFLVKQLFMPSPIGSIEVSIVFKSWVGFTAFALHIVLNWFCGGFILQNNTGFCMLIIEVVEAESIWDLLTNEAFNCCAATSLFAFSARFVNDSLLKFSVCEPETMRLRFDSIMLSIAWSQASFCIL